jgi:hypothetical protein
MLILLETETQDLVSLKCLLDTFFSQRVGGLLLKRPPTLCTPTPARSDKKENRLADPGSLVHGSPIWKKQIQVYFNASGG